MSIDGRAHALLTRLSAQLTGPLRKAYLQALDAMTANADFTVIEQMLRRGDVGAAVGTLLDAGRVPAQSILRARFGDMLDAGAAVTLKQGANVIAGRHFTNIVAGSPRAAAAMKRLELQFFPPIFKDTESVIRKLYTEGLNAGKNPRVIARAGRAFTGFTEYDYGILGTFEFSLRSGDYAAVLDRGLRDKRFDPLLKRAARDQRPLTEPEIGAQVQRYTERLRKWRSETWSRSAGLNAARESQLVAWLEAADAGGLETKDVVKTWITTIDGRERPAHHDANRMTVPIDALFAVDGGVQTPGQGVFNCRCTFTVRVLPKGKQAREKFLGRDDRNARAVLEPDPSKYIYPPHIITEEQKRQYRAQQRRIAKKGGGGGGAPPPIPPTPPKPAPPQTPRDIALDQLSRMKELPFTGGAEGGVTIDTIIDRKVFDNLEARKTQQVWSELLASRYTARTIPINPTFLVRTTNEFNRNGIEAEIRSLTTLGRRLSANKPIVADFRHVEYIYSGHEEIAARMLLGETKIDVHYLDLDYAQDAILRGSSLADAVQAGLTGIRWEPRIAPPPPPKPPEPPVGPKGKITYPPGMTDPKERQKYRAKLRRMAKNGIGNPPPPKGPPITAPAPGGPKKGAYPGWQPKDGWVRTSEPGTSYGGKYHEWRVYNESYERFIEMPEAQELYEKGMRISVGDKSLSRNHYGHFSPMPRHGPSHIAIRKNIELKHYGYTIGRDVDMVQEVMYHETGHAVDYWLWGSPRYPGSSFRKYWSESKEFIEAWEKDRRTWLEAKAARPAASPTLDYFGRPRQIRDGWYSTLKTLYKGYTSEDSLQKELVADLYAILHGADVLQGNIAADDVLKEFPTIVALMRRKMKGTLKR